MYGLQKKAFTLVELIVVISILSILAAISFISFTGYTKDAKDAKKIADIKNISNSVGVKFTQTNTIPEPDEPTTIPSLGNKLTTGVIGNDLSKFLGIHNIPVDPETGSKYTFSKMKRSYEIGTVINKTSQVSFITPTYAAGEQKIAKLSGNFDDYVVKISSGGVNYYMTLPSLTLSNLNTNISENTTTSGIVISGESNLPYTYSGMYDAKYHNNTLYTPTVLFSGATCGPQTYEDILMFVEKLQYSFSKINQPQYDVFKSLKTIPSKLDFGIQLIKDVGGCQTDLPSLPDVYPTQCGYPLETGDFENIPNNFDVTNSCLVSKIGTGTAEVRTTIGSGGTKGIYVKVDSSYAGISYKVTSKIPFKLSFDANFFLDPGYPYSNFKFLINGVPYVLKGNNENGLGYKNYTSPLLPAGDYDFQILVTLASYQKQDYMYIDNLKIICQGGGGTCGWTEGFEDGPALIGDNFSFEGFSPIPWNRVTGTGASEGTYGIITPPLLVGSQQTDIIYKKTLTQTGYLSFDYKLNFWGSTMEFYVDDIRFEHWLRRADTKSINMTNFSTFTSGLISPGRHTFRIRIGKGHNDGHTAIAYLDNFKTTYCTSTSVPNCGWTDGFEDGGSQNAYEQFTFTGAVKTAWTRVTGTGASTGTYGIISPELQNTSSTASLEFKRNFTQSGYLLFDYKAISNSGNNFKFYVDGVLKNSWDLTGNLDNYATYTSALLPAGNHTFRIDVFRNWHDGHYIRLFLDNIKVQY